MKFSLLKLMNMIKYTKLHPNVASIMNIDGDHYDIYSDFNDLKSFKKFSDNLKKDGILFHDSNLI